MAKSAMKAGMKPQRARNKFAREEKEKKAFEAGVRKELAEKRSAAEQLARLNEKGYAAVKERAKLAIKLQAVAAVVNTAIEMSEKPKKVKKTKDK
jgi:hypothetical protein